MRTRQRGEGQRPGGVERSRKDLWASPPPLSLPSSEVTHVVMEQTSAKEASTWKEHRVVVGSPQGRTSPVLLDISWFTESMAAGEPMPVEPRHCLEVSWGEGCRGRPRPEGQVKCHHLLPLDEMGRRAQGRPPGTLGGQAILASAVTWHKLLGSTCF